MYPSVGCFVVVVFFFFCLLAHFNLSKVDSFVKIIYCRPPAIAPIVLIIIITIHHQPSNYVEYQHFNSNSIINIQYLYLLNYPQFTLNFTIPLLQYLLTFFYQFIFTYTSLNIFTIQFSSLYSTSYN